MNPEHYSNILNALFFLMGCSIGTALGIHICGWMVRREIERKGKL